MSGNSRGKFNNDDSIFSFSPLMRSVQVGGQNKSQVNNQSQNFTFSSSSSSSVRNVVPKSSLDNATISPSVPHFTAFNKNNVPKQQTLNPYMVPIPSFPEFYELETTNFRVSIEKQVLIESISNFILEYDIDMIWKPMKYKFKCFFKQGDSFVIRLFQDDPNSTYIIEAQRRSGCSMVFIGFFNSLRTRILSLSPIMTNPPSNFDQSSLLFQPSSPLENIRTPLPLKSLSFIEEPLCFETIKSKLSSSLLFLSSPMIDSQEIAIEQLHSLLLKLELEEHILCRQFQTSKEEKEYFITLFIQIEKTLHQLIISFWRLKQCIIFERTLTTLNLFYDFRSKTMTESTISKVSVDYNELVIIILEALTSKNKFVSMSSALTIKPLVLICPEVFKRNDANQKLFFAIARQSQRDCFKSDFSQFENHLRASMTRLNLN